ncbi:TIGR01777 family oxidoreductase [Ferrimonas balearica]|uniref:TIGR01777 family oxidoreductase n=1 Tax=Ferrimonas balearica TaxID=44012 RepID=UPI002D7E9B30|nr:TIGR01777 family oxidoreductase [Ferrimonas balearica]MBY6017255.1 TIGR01777 family oxidoreductase [Halomonas denitrificans]MBY6093531.1 TIGR01777 family oxidoreductase [Ferrimonas balearica]
MKLLITGGTGFIGRALIARLAPSHDITVLTRNPERALAILGGGIVPLRSLATLTNLDAFDGVINLAGEPIADGRWTTQRKRDICDSRWQLTESLVRLHQAGSNPPSVWLNASAIGIYGPRDATPVDEQTPIAAMGFAEQVCERWEAIARRVSDQTRQCVVRIGLVMHPDGGALKKMLPAFRLGLGGPLGDGQQMMSWIHLQDLVSMLCYLLEHDHCRGVFNGTAPYPVSNKAFSHALGQALGRPAFLPAPAPVLRLALGEMSSLLLTGQAVLPNAAEAAGFQFEYPKLEDALADMFSRA